MLSNQKIDFAIITPLTVEWEAVCSRLNNITKPESHVLPTNKGIISDYSVLCIKTGKGEGNTAAALQDIMNYWKPRWVLLVGVAGGFPDAGLHKGDLIVSKIIHGIDFGKIVDDHYQVRHEYDIQPDHKLLSYAEIVAESGEQKWKQRIQKPRPDNKQLEITKAHVGNIGSGNKVIDDPDYKLYQDVKAVLPEIDAVEMEGSGAGASMRLEQSKRAVGFLMIRGISDEPSANDEKDTSGSSQRGEWKAYASDVAAAFTEELLVTLAEHNVKSSEYSINHSTKSESDSEMDLYDQLVYMYDVDFEEVVFRLKAGTKISKVLSQKERAMKLVNLFESKPEQLRHAIEKVLGN